MKYQMVPLTESLLTGLVRLEESCFEHPWSMAMFQGELNNETTVYRLLLDGETPIAYMGMWYVADEGQITNVAVHPDYRRKGLAESLISFFKNYAREHHLAAMTLEVRRGNVAARNLYEKMGFETVGLRKNYYEGKEDAVLMTLFLNEFSGENKGETERE